MVVGDFVDGVVTATGRQFDDEEGGGIADPDTYAPTDESDDPGTDMFGRQFGDGSNRWIPGIIETARNPVDRATNPYDTLAGAADAAALNFDEGVGGLVSLVDGEPGNTAGPGDDNVLAQAPTAGGGLVVGVVVLVVIGVVLWLIRPFIGIAEGVTA
jgi:hypothetical protein